MHRMNHRKAAGFFVGGISYLSSQHKQVGTDAYRSTDDQGDDLRLLSSLIRSSCCWALVAPGTRSAFHGVASWRAKGRT